ncbi:MAG: hypothetical protein WBD04_07670, partial [Candidatus Omnitrophota bacterium]
LETSRGIASKGLIVRLLVLAGGISGTIETLEFIAKELGRDVCFSVMSQYYPAYKVMEYKELSRRISRDEYYPVLDRMHELGLHSGWVQPFEGEFDERFAGENLPPSV